MWDVLPLTKEGQIIGQGMADKQFQLEEFKTYLDPYPKQLPDSMQILLANRYAELFGIFYQKRDKIARVTLWGVHDGMSWKMIIPFRAGSITRFYGAGIKTKTGTGGCAGCTAKNKVNSTTK